MFFNYRDFIVSGRPKYIEKCGPYAFSDIPETPLSASEMVVALNEGYLYYGMNDIRSEEAPGPYFLVTKGCGDCTVYGSNIKPDFWVD